MNSTPHRFTGHPLLSYGFRPFFLIAALYATAIMLAWLPFFYGLVSLATSFSPRDWHVHELLYGYLAAVITGFLLTAIPNWTGRLPLRGAALFGLVVVWVAGRVAVMFSASFGEVPTAIVDSAFLFLIAAAAAREIIAGRNWRNLLVLAPVTVLGAANVAFHVEASVFGTVQYGVRGGTAAIVFMLVLIGGRIIPSFTRNWLARRGPGRLPAPFSRFDGIAVALSAAVLTVWIVSPDGVWIASGMFAAGVFHSIRLARWAGHRTLREPLVTVLHVAYTFVPLGFLLTGMAAMGWILASAGLHAWLAGAAGTMTLAVMTRATLGHTGRDPSASWGTQAIFAAVLIAASVRIAAGVLPTWYGALLYAGATAWVIAFIGFTVVYGPMLTKRRLTTKNAT